MKTAYEWMIEEDEKDDGCDVSKELVRRIQIDALFDAIGSCDDEIHAHTPDIGEPSARQMDCISAIANVRRKLIALRDEIQADQENEDAHEKETPHGE